MRQDGMLLSSQAAEFLGISKSTLLRLEKEQVLVPDLRDQKTRYRYYSIETLKSFQNKRFEDNRLTYAYKSLPSKDFTFIDLFSGIGGIRLAFERAGGRCVFSSEIDQHAVMTYEHVFGEKPYGDIVKIKSTDIPPHDILLAGFPCQPFSIAGVSKYGSLGRKHGFKDRTKGTLFFEIARILEYHRPKAFLLENVKNLKSHDKGKTWQVIRATLEQDLKYTIFTRILDARTVVPQHRERIFIVGFREPLSYEWPEIPDLKPKFINILDTDVDPKYTLSDHLWNYLQNYAEKHKEKGNGFGFGLTDLNGTSRTLSARYHKDGSEILVPQKNDKNPRRLTPSECARLMGFPPIYEKPVVSDTQAYRQFGNAVVVPLSK